MKKGGLGWWEVVEAMEWCRRNAGEGVGNDW